jgi:hypothetical protein
VADLATPKGIRGCGYNQLPFLVGHIARIAIISPLIPPGKSGEGKRTVIMRGVVNGLMYATCCGHSARDSCLFTSVPPSNQGHHS